MHSCSKSRDASSLSIRFLKGWEMHYSSYSKFPQRKRKRLLHIKVWGDKSNVWNKWGPKLGIFFLNANLKFSFYFAVCKIYDKLESLVTFFAVEAMPRTLLPNAICGIFLCSTLNTCRRVGNEVDVSVESKPRGATHYSCLCCCGLALQSHESHKDFLAGLTTAWFDSSKSTK